MTSKLLRRVLIGGGAVVGLLVVVVLLLPSLIDLNGRKPEIAAAVKKATGRDLVLDGPISLSLLPTPVVTLTNVKFFNAPGSSNASMVEVKSVSVKPSLVSLLSGELAPSEVTLVEPKIVLEIDAQGRPNWEFAPSVAAARPATSAPSSGPSLSLGRLTIENGTLIFSDAKAGLSVVAEKADVTASVPSSEGPYSVKVSATVAGAPLRLDVTIGTRNPDGYPTELQLEAAGGRLSFKGYLTEIAASGHLVGMASVSADDLIAFVGALATMTGQPRPDLPPLLAGKFAFDGAIDAAQTSVAAKNFRLAFGQDSAKGSATVTLSPKLAIDADLVADRIDLDRWLASLTPAPPPAATAPPPAGATAQPAPPPGPSALASIAADLSFEVGEVVYKKQAIRSVALQLEAQGGAVAVPKLAATLPGDLVLQARSTMSGDPSRPTVAGEFSLVGPKLRQTLDWLAVDVSSVPADKLQRLSLKGRMASTGGNVQVSDAAFELDDLKGTGGITVTFGVPLAIVAQVNLDTLDLDSYLAAPAGGSPAGGAPAAASSAASRVLGPTIGLKARIARLIWHKETIGGVDVDVALRGSTLRLNDVKVSNLGGARLAVRGTVANYDAAQPRPDIAFNFDAPDLDRVLKVVGTAPTGIGAVTASGGVAGSLEQVALREFTLNAAGQSVRATGTLSLPGAAQGTPKSAAYKGNLVLNGQALDGSVDATLSGRPQVNADLRANVLDLGKIGGSGAAAKAPARGRPAAAAPIDTGPLRSVDGSFKLAATSLVDGSLRIGNADLAATLKGGVLTIAHFKGAIYGGTLALSGVVNASQPALAIDLKGDVTGLYISEMLRGLAGTNEFGSTIKVTVDGRLNASGLTVRAAGATADQIRKSMAGGAQLGGHIFVGADKALQFIGTALAGVAGGVIDQTLGNLLGAAGQQGGIGASNMLNAISLVLNRFVNRDNPISGRVDIAGGLLTDKGLAVQGNRATAHIATRTNIAASTTDTTINVVIAEDTSAPYLVTTARGPLSSPALRVARGTAKDPPGMKSTLPGAASNIPGIGNIVGGQGGQQQQQQQQQQQPSQRSPIQLPIQIPNIFGR
ncbi:AsmA family protein [Reyranella sp.]|uniref:AsmA family protein n=1 Tax=Reyranella sp. TaxID=1929291 RepID=UPI003BAA8B77